MANLHGRCPLTVCSCHRHTSSISFFLSCAGTLSQLAGTITIRAGFAGSGTVSFNLTIWTTPPNSNLYTPTALTTSITRPAAAVVLPKTVLSLPDVHESIAVVENTRVLLVATVSGTDHVVSNLFECLVSAGLLLSP